MAQRKKKSGRSKSNGAAPAGFREVEPTHLSGFWKPKDVGDRVQGLVGEMKRGKGTDGKPNVYFQLDLTSDDCGPVFEKNEGKQRKIDVGGGMMIGVSGWATLVGFMRANEGKEVLIVFNGHGEAQAGKHAPLMFKTYVRDAT